ncbi:MAG: hypothetical protein JXR36_05425 [Bacteroidales bacterium]|nr:hypothetical protein [Bacteroidales bacterium]
MKTKTLSLLITLLIAILYLTNSCNDDDCNKSVWYEDYDEDGYGNPDVSKMSCNQPDGYLSDNTDFNDSSASAYPGALEICTDNIDNDNDSFVDCDDFDCDCDESANCHDGIDNDNDGYVDCDDFDCECD